MFIGHIPLRNIIYTVLGVACLGIILVTIALTMPENNKNIGMHRMSTWQERIAVFKSHKENVPATQFDVVRNNQVAHANIAIATSNTIGNMPGNSTQRDFLSQAYSDFIFAIIIEELGLLGGLFVVILYVWLLIRAGLIAKKARGNFASMLVIGLTLMIVSQALLNMCVAVGLLPVTGQTLPLISKGGTSTIVNCIYLGMILSISRYIQSSEAEKHNGITPNMDDSSITKETLDSDEKLIDDEK